MGGWGNRIAIFACVAVVTICTALVLPRFDILDALPAAITSFCICVAAILFVRQTRLSRELERERAQRPSQTEQPQRERADKSPALPPPVGPATEPLPAPHIVHQTGDEAPVAQEAAVSEAAVGQPAEDRAVSFVEPPPSEGGAIEEVPARPSAPPADASATDRSATDLIMYLQPIVALDDRRPWLFDAQFRLRLPDGALVAPSHYGKIARSKGLTAGIDRRATMQSLRFLKNLLSAQSSAEIICGITQESVADLESFERLMQAVRRDKQAAEALTIAIAQRDFNSLSRKNHVRLRALADVCRGLMLDDVRDFHLDVPLLAHLGFGYLRMQSALFLHASVENRAGLIEPAELAGLLRGYGINLIIADLDRDSDIPKLLEREVGLAQGDQFAPMRPARGG